MFGIWPQAFSMLGSYRPAKSQFNLKLIYFPNC